MNSFTQFLTATLNVFEDQKRMASWLIISGERACFQSCLICFISE